MDLKEQLKALFEALAHKRALIHHITNYVTVNDCANTVLAIGASPIMADALQEVEAMVSLCDALVLNIGTLNAQTFEAMQKAASKANAKQIPVVLDPVGVGATPFRLQSVTELLRHVRMDVVRGNMAEIKTIAGLEAKSSGVDSLDDEADGGLIAASLAKKLQCTIAITGKEDIVSNGNVTYRLQNGDALLTNVTGTGCMTTSLIGSFLGTKSDALISAIAGISTMAIASELADKTKGIGSFRVSLIDEISKMDAATLHRFLRIQNVL